MHMHIYTHTHTCIGRVGQGACRERSGRCGGSSLRLSGRDDYRWDETPWGAGTIGRGPQGRNAAVRRDETSWCAGHECRRGK